jgi:thioredoxin-like negative regulator of GroEL
MNLLMVRARLKEENAADAKAATEKVIQALEQERPADVRYASCVLNDGVTFVALLEMEPGQEHPLRTLPAYVDLIENLKQWYAEPPTVEYMTVIGSYQLF